LTYDELVALIIVLPVLAAGSYTLIVIFWILINVEERARRILAFVKRKERNRNDTTLRDRD
jgi:hypothetical protein